MASTVVSCSGKVLLAGGYLVLDRNYTGLVASTSSRFYTVIRQSAPPVKSQIYARSPQFLDANWHYNVAQNDGTLLVDQVTDKSVYIPLVQRETHLIRDPASDMSHKTNSYSSLFNARSLLLSK
jgi:phosphomevalonate kinase